MTQDYIPITQEGLKRMEEELLKLKTIDKPAIIAAIAEAREHGDLSENAEYHAAREKQGFIEAKIKDLEARVSRAKVIDVAAIKSDFIQFGATVILVDEETNQEKKYKLVGDYEADLTKNYISISSPVARALIGKKKGEVAEVFTPRGNRYYTILSFEFI